MLLFALAMVSSSMAYNGQIACLTNCSASNVIAMSGPGSTKTATFWLYATNAPVGTTMNYYVCPQSASSCSSASGADNGWSWTFTPTSGTTGTGPASCGTSCEGNGAGSPSTLSLQITAPTTVTPTNQQETLTIYACSIAGTTQTCNSAYQQTASLTVSTTVPQFGLGIGLIIAIGLVGLVLVKRRNTPKLASTAGITTAA